MIIDDDLIAVCSLPPYVTGAVSFLSGLYSIYRAHSILLLQKKFKELPCGIVEELEKDIRKPKK